jgi:hypothetical protein
MIPARGAISNSPMEIPGLGEEDRHGVAADYVYLVKYEMLYQFRRNIFLDILAKHMKHF